MERSKTGDLFGYVEGSRIPGLLDRVTAYARAANAVTLIHKIRASSGSPEEKKVFIGQVLLDFVGELSVEVDEDGRLTIGQASPTFPESHNGGTA